MKMKKLFSLSLIVCMLITLFAACNSDNNTNISSTPSGGVTSSEPTPNESGDEDSQGNEISEITFAGFMYTSYPTGEGTVIQQVEDAINELTEREIGVHVNFIWTPMADYSTQLTLDIAANKTIDVAHYWYRGNISHMYSNGAALDITDLLHEHATDIVELQGWILDLATFEGRIYGVPTYRQLNGNQYIIFRADILEEAGMREKAESMTTWSEYEEIMAAIVSSTTSYGMGTTAQVTGILGPTINIKGDRFSEAEITENLGDSLAIIGVDDGKVFNILKSDGATSSMKMIADWADKGYVWPDSPYSNDIDKSIMSYGTFASALTGSEYGVEGVWQSAIGSEVLAVKLWSNVMNGSAARGLGAFVPSSSADPVSAIKFINLLYTNAELMNLITWGIEGVSYVVEDGIAKYPEGIDTQSSGYHLPDYMIGNQFLVTPWNGTPANFRELAHADFLDATLSNYLGFAADITGINTLYSSLSAVWGEYYGMLTKGEYSDSLYNEYVEKLDSIGVDEYISLFQEQLNEFIS